MKGMWVIAAVAACRIGDPAPPKAREDARSARVAAALVPTVQIVGEDQSTPLLARMNELHVPAVSIAVFENYDVVWTQAYGLADVEHGTAASADTLFQAGSISKSVNALAVLEAADEKVLSLDTPINAQLTSWQLPDNELTKKTPVTLRHLLSHTGGTTVHGFPGYAVGESVPTIVQVLDGQPPANTPPVRVDLAPGTFRYSGGGTTITQLALVEHDKEPYAKILAKRVLDPLGMTRSTYEQPLPPEKLVHAAVGYHADGAPVVGMRHTYPEQAAAGLWTTPRDLAVFFAEVAKARAGRSKTIKSAIAKQMTEKVADVRGIGGVGLGVFLSSKNGAQLFGHDGADDGFQALALASLDEGYGVIVMANSDNGLQLAQEIVRTVFVVHGWHGADKALVRFAMTAEARARFVGVYQPPQFAPLFVDERDGKLLVHQPFGPTRELVPINATTVIGPQGEWMTISTEGALEFPVDGGVAHLPKLDDPNHPMVALVAGRFDDAVAEWKARAAKDPDRARVDEETTNLLGYELVVTAPADAIMVLRLVAMTFPESSNAHDSLGEAYLRAGDKAHAIEEYEKAIATLDADPRIPAERKPTARANAEKQLAALRK